MGRFDDDMKNLFTSHLLLFSIAFTLLTGGCDDLDFTQFEMDYNTEYTYNAGLTSALPFNARTPEIQSNSSSKFSANNTRKDKIEELKLKSMTLSIKSPNSANFDFLNEIEIYIAAEGLKEQLIASKSDIPENGSTTIEMDVKSSLNLEEYIKKNEFVFTTTTRTDKTVNQNITVEINSVFFVDAELL